MGAIAEMALSGSAAEQKTKVLLVVSPTTPRLARHVLALARGLDRTQLELSLACPRDAAVAEEAESLGLEVLRVAVPYTPSPVRAMSAALALSRSIARGAFHLVHSHSFPASLAASLAREFTAWPILVCSIHDSLKGPRRMGAAVHRWLLRMIARKADRIVTTCAALQSPFCDVRGAAEKLVTMPDGVDLERPGDPAYRAKARATMGVADHAVVVGVLGAIPHAEPTVELRQVLDQVQSRHSQAEVVFTTFGPAQAAAAEQSGGPGDYLVPQSQVDAVDLAVIVPPCDGFPTEAVQAMAAAKPVCGYAVGSLSEVVAEGETGLLAPEGDADALAAAIEALLTDRERARAMGEAGRDRARQLFSLPTMIERTQELYADLARTHLLEGGRP